jgi:hypothetical protein
MATRRRTRRPRKQTIAVEEPRHVAIAGWTVARIEQAKRRADVGDLALAADLWSRVLGDERALGPLQAVAGISALELTFESATDKKRGDDSADPLVQALAEDWYRFLPEETQGEILRWACGLGGALVHVKDWVNEESGSGRLLSVLDVWHPRALWWDDENRTFRVRTRSDRPRG